jgi:hypothetical protein
MRRHDRRRAWLRASLMYASYHLAILHELPMGTEVAFPPQRHQPHTSSMYSQRVVVRRMETLETQGLLLVCGGGWTGGSAAEETRPGTREGRCWEGRQGGSAACGAVYWRDQRASAPRTQTDRETRAQGQGARASLDDHHRVSGLFDPSWSQPAAAIRQSVGDAMSSIRALIGKGVSWTSAGSSIVRRTVVQLSSLSRALLLHSSVISGASRSGLFSDKTNVGRVEFALLPARLV